jgi:hypothetical protein
MSLNESTTIKDRIAATHIKQKRLRVQIREVEDQLSSSSEVDGYARDDLMALFEEALDSPRLKQKFLLASGYQISINDNLASIYNKSAGISMTFKLIKRSTKFNCYILHASAASQTLEGKEYLDGLPSDMIINYMMAINREEEVIQVEGSDINNLLSELEELKAQQLK